MAPASSQTLTNGGMPQGSGMASFVLFFLHSCGQFPAQHQVISGRRFAECAVLTAGVAPSVRVPATCGFSQVTYPSLVRCHPGRSQRSSFTFPGRRNKGFCFEVSAGLSLKFPGAHQSRTNTIVENRYFVVAGFLVAGVLPVQLSVLILGSAVLLLPEAASPLGH